MCIRDRHKVKELLGPDAIILSNRAIPGGVEIMAVAAGDMDMLVPTSAREEPRRNDDYTVRLSSPTSQAPLNPRPVASPPLAPSPAPYFERPVAQTQAVVKPQAEIVPSEVMEEIRSLRKMFEQHLAGAAWGESARSEPVKTEILRQMLDAGFSPRFARELLADLPRDLNAKQALAWVSNCADRSFLTINADSDIVDRGGVYALVGPVSYTHLDVYKRQVVNG